MESQSVMMSGRAIQAIYANFCDENLMIDVSQFVKFLHKCHDLVDGEDGFTSERARIIFEHVAGGDQADYQKFIETLLTISTEKYQRDDGRLDFSYANLLWKNVFKIRDVDMSKSLSPPRKTIQMEAYEFEPVEPKVLFENHTTSNTSLAVEHLVGHSVESLSPIQMAPGGGNATMHDEYRDHGYESHQVDLMHAQPEFAPPAFLQVQTEEPLTRPPTPPTQPKLAAPPPKTPQATQPAKGEHLPGSTVTQSTHTVSASTAAPTGPTAKEKDLVKATERLEGALAEARQHKPQPSQKSIMAWLLPFLLFLGGLLVALTVHELVLYDNSVLSVSRTGSYLAASIRRHPSLSSFLQVDESGCVSIGGVSLLCGASTVDSADWGSSAICTNPNASDHTSYVPPMTPPPMVMPGTGLEAPCPQCGLQFVGT